MDAQTLVMIQILTTALIVSAFGFILCLLSYFLDFCFWEGNIFQFWLPWLSKQITKRFYKLKYDHIMASSGKDFQNKAFVKYVGGMDNGLFKMLGGCAICLNIWIGLITFPFIALPLGISLWYYPVYLLTASFFLRKIMRDEM